MRVFDPPHVMEFVWGEDVLRIELAPITGGTVLTLTDTFGLAPGLAPALRRRMTAA